MGKNENIEHLRHSLSHLLAAAVLNLYRQAKPTLGPAIENGFYYDFDDLKISDEDLPKIEERMKEILPTWQKFEGRVVNEKEARDYFKDNPYKLELIDEIISKGEKITFYTSGEFTDLCRGGHIDNPDNIDPDSFKLSRIAGAYWRGDEKNKMLTRIYGLAFSTKNELEKYVAMQEEAEKRDHRKLGKQMDLFTFSNLVGSGLPLYTPRGALLRRLLTGYVEELQSKDGYTQVWTPQISKAELFKTSGHYDKYKDGMFKVTSNYSDEEFFLKPMNCPQHTQIYKSQQRSYRDLPIRYTDFAMLYRDEKPGEINGLARVRSFSQDDCHVFCSEDQVDEELDKMFSMIKQVMSVFNFKYRFRLSTRDPDNKDKYLGDPKIWDKVEDWAIKVMERNKIDYFDGPGEAAFYAPKMDLLATDALGREWQLSTTQIDYVMPDRFDLTYVDKDGKEKRPVMLHRAIIGSAERFLMILLEHYAGAFPLWLSPIQVKIMSIGEAHQKFAKQIFDGLKEVGIRAELDNSNETLGKKIRNWKIEKTPYAVVVGDKEVESKELKVESRDNGDLGHISTEQFIKNLREEIENKG